MRFLGFRLWFYACQIILVVGALATALTLYPRVARSAACCTSATSFGVGRLRAWEQWTVSIGGDLTTGVGYWSETGALEKHGDDFMERQWRTSLAGLFRLGERLQAFAVLPTQYMLRSAGDLRDFGGGIGDTQTGVRYDIIDIGEFLELPALAVTVGVIAPSGKSMNTTSSPLAADVTGRGAWAVGLGVTVEKAVLPWFVQGSANLSVPLPFVRADTGKRQRFGPTIGIRIASGLELLPDSLVLSGALRASREARLNIGGQSVKDSEKSDIGLGLSLSWQLDPRFTAIAAVDSGIFADNFGDNSQARVVGSLALRYGHF